ncbi:Gfo/Idh/MocA family protein [Ammoniphilus sp. YIM 78166]|uniref:Gfo/Idh/MocA family protein n=1 Tax=Ammoniphilus sp. YIM 78166 TaxID=1644106 RepID=UPI00106F4257|nr:Gfo/Idh/MocA family oxidoreductase [Ammoniphilus sp. YIM 78166]
MGQKLKGVILGAGHFADIQLEAWQSVQGAEMKGILSRTKKNAEVLAQKYGLQVYDDFDQMILDIQPDFVDVCTPPDVHLHYTILSADRGIPVLCQKPVAPSLEESEALVQYCLDRKVPLMINENWRWQGWYREIKNMIDQGMLGKVYHTYFAMRPGDGWGNDPYPVQPFFKDMKQFLIYETGVHWIDTFRYLFGEIRSVYCQIRKINSVVAGEDLAIIHFDFRNGMTGIYDANRTTYMEEVRSPAYGWMTLEGTEGKLRLEQDGRIYYTPRGGLEKEHAYTIPPGWKGGCAIATQQHFIDGLLKGISYESSGPEYLKTVRVVYACYESARQNQVVHLEE